MKNNTKDVVGYRISQLDRPFDLKPNQATSIVQYDSFLYYKNLIYTVHYTQRQVSGTKIVILPL